MQQKFWLMKSEPSTFSIDHLAALPHQTEHWEGVRNYQARNFMRDEMKVGDEAFFYHSNCDTPGIVGIVTIVKSAYPDHFALKKSSPYYDPKSTTENPRWYMVDVKLKQKFDTVISLRTLKENTALAKMPLVQKGNRLSILPVTANEWRTILKMLKK
ncbi:EVE domain-containing protein [Candidatus Berkiella cookevillensis]|uniref:EVE domain protein n=1 Tax=Candidatus Berkiella cookevillensis TaxID=437022 RepID=A0A0Q9YAR2_9GAMM|nr:EVE domain-containing protein [Candidatus Berkiella cookevillensis]MCS5709566.1 EVE domain-containing protein [Candidatus Berkiella cookevillensis]